MALIIVVPRGETGPRQRLLQRQPRRSELAISPFGLSNAAGTVSWGGEDPIESAPVECYHAAMNLLLLIIVLLLLFGGGGFYFGGPVIGGGGVGLILLICLIVFLMGGFRAKT